MQGILGITKGKPYPKLMEASRSGILKKIMATSIAVRAPAMAHQCGFTLSPASNANNTIIGSAASSVDNHQWPSGSYTWVQVIAVSLRWIAAKGGENFLQFGGQLLLPWRKLMMQRSQELEEARG